MLRPALAFQLALFGWLSPATAEEGGQALTANLVASGLPNAGQWRNGFALADFDGDGEVDLLHGPPRRGDGTPLLYLGDGTGGFEAWAEARFPPAELDYGDAAAADFDGDGHMDTAFAVHSGGFFIFFGDGAGNFTRTAAGLPSSAVEGFSSRTIEVADWDADGRPDLLALGENPRTAGGRGLALLSNKAGEPWVVSKPGTPKSFGDSIALGDWNQDGRIDAALGLRTVSATELVQIQTKGGSWKTADVGALPSEAFFPAVATMPTSGGDRIAVSWRRPKRRSWTSGIDVLLWREEGWQRRSIIAGISEEVSALAACRVDDDDVFDLAAGTADGSIHLFLNAGSDVVTKSEAPDLTLPAFGCRVYSAQCRDLDHDGRDELVVGFANEPSEACPSGGALQVWRFEEIQSGEPE